MGHDAEIAKPSVTYGFYKDLAIIGSPRQQNKGK